MGIMKIVVHCLQSTHVKKVLVGNREGDDKRRSGGRCREQVTRHRYHHIHVRCQFVLGASCYIPRAVET